MSLFFFSCLSVSLSCLHTNLLILGVEDFSSSQQLLLPPPPPQHTHTHTATPPQILLLLVPFSVLYFFTAQIHQRWGRAVWNSGVGQWWAAVPSARPTLHRDGTSVSGSRKLGWILLCLTLTFLTDLLTDRLADWLTDWTDWTEWPWFSYPTVFVLWLVVRPRNRFLLSRECID